MSLKSYRKMIKSGSLIELYETWRETEKRETTRQKNEENGGAIGVPFHLDTDTKEEARRYNQRRAKRHLERLVYANHLIHGEKTKILTLTHSENWGLEEANPYFSKFIKRVNYDFRRELKYISVPEFQKRGSVHFHVIFFNLPFRHKIYSYLRERWGAQQLWLDTKNIRDGVPSIIKYVSKYMVKNFDDPRMKNRRKYYPSSFLIQPKVLEDDVTIEQVNWYLHDKKSYENEYLEPFTNNRVKYRRWLVDEFDRNFLDDRINHLTAQAEAIQ